MFQFELLQLHPDDAYFKAQSLLDEIIEQYNLSNYEGILDTTLHEFFILINHKFSELNIEFLVENNQILFVFSFAESIDNPFLSSEDNNSLDIIERLTDEVLYDSDNKMFTLLFHVKRSPQQSDGYLYSKKTSSSQLIYKSNVSNN